VTTINLRRLMVRDQSASALVTLMVEVLANKVAVEDVGGSPIIGASMPGAPRRAITLDDRVLGWVVGEDGGVLLTLLHYIINQEVEKSDLARDALEKYRELNLLYGLAERIGASLEVQAVATAAIGEAKRLIKTGEGLLLLKDEAGEGLRPVQGEELLAASVGPGEGILGRIVQSDRGEIVNDVLCDPRRGPAEAYVRSLLAVPLATRGAVIGTLGIASGKTAAYTAADLKLLTVIAAQVAPTIDSALHYERAVREAEERERYLQQQLAELRIEIDGTRQSRQVAAIVGTEYFQRLRQEAGELRRGLG
jgi:GAF domain-containing protein